ncbi:MAG TPA: DUF3467 domain-containing protein [Candidatus Limisoma intestinavium]|uniref:DUF3467 domain-containing protein n=1 Tax=Candidatus Limisoma intestinavium TaxID=2840856 RepID=A0A9D1IP27_9BACT|nr:DUF3467 domain-containing protein [Candidatus Limisoma intestinavium]
MNENNEKREIKIELTPETAAGKYANLAIITHSPNEFFIDFINVVPNTPQARVQSRIIMTPENAKTLLMALQDNVRKYETAFGTIKPRTGNLPQNGNVPFGKA